MPAASCLQGPILPFAPRGLTWDSPLRSSGTRLRRAVSQRCVVPGVSTGAARATPSLLPAPPLPVLRLSRGSLSPLPVVVSP